MAVSVRNTANSGNTSGTSFSVTVPSGLSVGDVTFAAVSWVEGTITWPAGWNRIALASNTIGFSMAYRAYQAGDPSSITVTNSASGWATGSAVAYAGCDVANPIDAVTQDSSFSVPLTSFRAPRLVPRYRGGRILSVFAAPNDSGGAAAAPSVGGKTTLFSNVPGPNVIGYDSTVADDGDTGEFALTWSSRTFRVGVSIALRVASAVASSNTDASPYFAGSSWINVSAAAYVPHLDDIGVQDGDLVFVSVQNANTITPPAGWSTLRTVAGVNTIFYRTWRTGDPTEPSFGISPSSWHTSVAFLVRKRRSDASDPAIDAHNTANANSSVTTPDLTPAEASGVFIGLWGIGNQAGATLTATPSLTFAASNMSGPCLWLGWKQPAGNPTGQYTATVSQVQAMAGTGIAVKSTLPPAASSANRRKPRPWQAGSRRGNSYRTT